MQFGGSEEGWQVLDEWSQGLPDYDYENNRARWDAGFAHNKGKQTLTSMRNLVFEARDAGGKFKPATLAAWGLGPQTKKAKKAISDSEDPEAEEDAKLQEAIRNAWAGVDTAEWGNGERAPGAVALVKGWMYEGAVTLFSSHGGSGKSYVSLTFAVLAASGATWGGAPMTQGNVLFVSGEDPLNEIRHRVEGICTAYGVEVQDVMQRLHIVDVTGVLHKALYTAGVDFGKTEFTEHYDHLCEKLEAGGYKYLMLDNLAKFYMANENIRPMVDEFVSALAALATARGAGVLLIGHDAKAGATGYSGSTAWHNSVRSRWTLMVKDGNHDLVIEKNNYGKAGHGLRFAWDEAKSILAMGETLGPDSASAQFENEERLEELRETVMSLYAQGDSVWASKKAPLGAIKNSPWVLENNIDSTELHRLLDRCVERGILATEEVKDKRRKTVRVRYCPSGDDMING
jgi:hypothetical protein